MRTRWPYRSALCSAAQLDVCGKAPLNTRIVGGADAPDGAWPWQVSMHFGGYHRCGGSLINNQWVLSAGHCVQGLNASTVTVYIGRKNQSGSNPHEVSRSISQIFAHPNYSSSTLDNDMSLLKMASPVNFTDYIRPVCLAASGSALNAGTNIWNTGFGALSYPGASATILQEVEMPIVGNRECACNFTGNAVTDNMLCAGLDEGGKGACFGDSGGPLVYKASSAWIQFGVVSFGIPCAVPAYPSVYARVSQYEDWIKSHITENQPGFISFTSSGTDSDLSVTCAAHSTTTPPPATNTTNNNATTAPPAINTTTPKSTTTPATTTTAAPPSVSEGQWPWMVSIQKNQVHVCGGTLVSENAVLSDSSCLPSDDHKRHQEQQQRRSNVVVLKLASKPTLSNYIQPICLDDGQNTFAEGTHATPPAGAWRQQVRVFNTLNTKCAQTLREIQTSIVSCGNTSSANTLCTETFTLTQGEYGGPLVCKVGGSWFQTVVLFNTNSTTRANMMTFERLLPPTPPTPPPAVAPPHRWPRPPRLTPAAGSARAAASSKTDFPGLSSVPKCYHDLKEERLPQGSSPFTVQTTDADHEEYIETSLAAAIIRSSSSPAVVPELHWQFIVEVDASDVGIGAVPSHRNPVDERCHLNSWSLWEADWGGAELNSGIPASAAVLPVCPLPRKITV
ncbi:hypothetical protein WMY93_001867 [Mugilogobius chulae]|uniref:Peptidase S1 domain-containing protein n=1 Tax=Mugilogobius chulae TaxID=88201 RepID=A0AAW0Q711_9GOBI